MRHQPRHRPPRRDLALSHPVARGIAIRRMQQVLTTLQTQLYMTDDGADATETLAHLGWQLGMAAQAAVWSLGPQHPTSRLLHGALRTVHQLCLSGYTWRAELAPALDSASTTAHQVLLAHASWAQCAIPDADHLASLIRAHRVQADTIVGAELYSQPPEAVGSTTTAPLA